MAEATPPRLKIAIIGAGIGGLTAAIAFLRHAPHIEIQIYEQATSLRAIGASIALGPNGLRTLEKLGVHNALEPEIAFRGPSGKPMIYRHWKTNEILSVDEHQNVSDWKHRTARFHRAHLQEALLQHVPPEKISLRKRARDVTVSDENVRVEFEDGDVIEVDILLGADGIHSKVRKNFAPEHQLNWTGWVPFRSVFDASLVEGIEDLPEDSTHWWGPDRNLFASRLGKNIFCIVGGYNDDPKNPDAIYKDAKWDGEGDINLLREYYKDWHPVIQKLVQATPSTRLHPNVSGSALPTWIFHERVTLIGDAAHTHGGAFAAGGSLAIDDAYAFYLAVSSAFPSGSAFTDKPTTQDIGRALRVYEKTRLPHVTKVLDMVRDQMLKKQLNGTAPGVGADEADDQLRKRAGGRADPSWIHEHNVEESFRAVLRDDARDELVPARL